MAPSTDSAMRGGFINMSLETGRAEMVRATCEGVAHNLRWLLPHVEALTGNAVAEIMFLGGAAKSAEWPQIIADVLDRPVRVATDPGTAIARGTALLALHRHGTLSRADLSTLVSAGDSVEPTAGNRAIYDRHQPQFEAAFEALRPIAQALGS
jgi:xylulokinase